jgi:hypothetical protein
MTRDDWLGQFRDELKKLRPHVGQRLATTMALQKYDPKEHPRCEKRAHGHARKDHSLVPINTDFDLYSMGPDGRSSPPLTAQHSRDDIVRANNGAFIGIASEY